MAACIGKTRCLIGQKKPFDEFIENASKQEESTSTHRASNVLSFTSARSNLLFELADPMNQASRICDDKTGTGKGRVAKMEGGLGPRACKVTINIGIKAIDIGGSENEPFIMSTIEIMTNTFNCLVVHRVGILEIASTQINSISNVRLCALSKEVQVSHNGMIGTGSLGVFFGIGTWLENFVHWSGMCLDSFRRQVLTTGKKAKIGKNAIDEANLGECYAVDEVGCRVNILVNVNTKIVCDWTLIFKHKVSANEHINHSIIDGKNATDRRIMAMGHYLLGRPWGGGLRKVKK